MKRSVSSLIIGLALVAVSSAQTPIPLEKIQPPPGFRPQSAAPPADDQSGLQGERKLRWICKQLRLSDEQMQQAEALIAVYNAELKAMEAEAVELLQKIQDKYAQIQAAKAQGDTQAVQTLQEELRNMAPGVQAENHFFEGLQEVLNDEQKERLPAIRKRAAAAVDIMLRPVHVLRAVRKLTLTSEQDQKVEKLLADFRQKQVTSRPSNQQAAEEQVDQLVADIRALLTEEQAALFEREITILRDDPPPARPIELPSPQTKPASLKPRPPVIPPQQ